MSRIGLVCSEPLRPKMAGIGIRFAEFARHLSTAGHEVVLASPADPEETRSLGLPAVDVRSTAAGFGEVLQDCQAAVTQGSLADHVLQHRPDLPTVVDLYDPWLVENVQYYSLLGPDLFRSDHASWVRQLSQGDFFLCSSPEQRQFYLGFLTLLGRVHPLRLRADPELRDLIAAVPFGVPAELPEHRPFLPPRGPGERRLLFGALYDWYDPWPVLEALEGLDHPDWRLYFIGSPNPGSTPQEQLWQVKEWCHLRGAEWWGERVQVIESLPPERRYDLLRDVDLLVSTHRPGLETDLSLRTRFLDALAVGCPVVATEGGTMSRLVGERSAGWVVPPHRADAVSSALEEILTAPERGEIERRRRHGRALASEFEWGRAVKPLLDFCREPRVDAIKGNFAVIPTSLVKTVQATPTAIAQAPPGQRGPLRKVSVALVSWNGREHLEACLPALAAQADPGVEWEVLLLDNGSTDGTAEWVAGTHPEVRLVRSERNLGFSQANNRLVEAAEGDAVALLNNDARPGPTWLGELVETLGSSPGDVAAVAGLIVDWEGERLDFAQSVMRFDGHAFHIGEGRRLDTLDLPATGEELFSGCAANMLIDREAFREAGGFDPAYFAYFEDVDLAWRLRSAGRKTRFSREARVHHRSHATGGRLNRAHRWFLYERNALLTVFKNYEDALLEPMMSVILLGILWRIKTILNHGEPRADFLAEDPFASLAEGVGLGPGGGARSSDSSVPRVLQKLRGVLSSLRQEQARAPGVTLADDASRAVFSALSNFLTHLDQVTAKRRVVQGARKRSDFGIFERFPLALVPHTPGEEQLFASELFQSLLPKEVPYVRASSREELASVQGPANTGPPVAGVGLVTTHRVDFSVVIPTYNGMRVLPEVLRGLQAQEGAPGFEVVVVDDGSTDGTAARLREGRWGLDLHVVSQANHGPAAARNAGVQAARGRLIAFLGDDTVPGEGWLRAHADGHRRHTDAGPLAVLGYTGLHPRVSPTPFETWINEEGLQFGYPLIEDPEDVEFRFFYSSNLSLPRQTLQAEPFDVCFPYAAWEDIELGYRLKKSGLRLVLDREAVALHDHPTSLRQFAARQEAAGYSAVLFYRRHPELAGFLRVDPARRDAPSGGLRARTRRVAAHLTGRLGLRRPDLWDELLRHHYALGVERAWRQFPT